MASIPLIASLQSSPPLMSLEAYVLAHLVDVSAATHGVLRSLVVAPDDVVRGGQTVAFVDPVPRRGQTHDHILPVAAPAAGLVIRCWAAPGESLRGDEPILTIARSEQVIVIARFPSGILTRIRRGTAATVRVGGGEGDDIAATVVSAVEAPDADAAADASGGRSTRVVLSIPEAPPAALWPGTAAGVEIDRADGRPGA